MLNLVGMTVAILLAYFLPGFTLSYALFPKREDLSTWLRILFSFGLSPGIVTLTMFLNAVTGLQMVPILLIIGVMFTTICFYIIYRWQRKSRHSENIIETEQNASSFPRPLFLLLISGTIIILFFIIIHALLLPIANWDALTEFAFLGRLYFQEGSIPTITGATLGIHSSANYPPLVPLLYTWFYLLSGSVQEIFAKAVSPIYCFFTVVVTYILAKKMYGSKEIAWSSVFFMISTPIVMMVSEDCLADSQTMFYFASSILFLFMSLTESENKDRNLVASGLMGGLAAWSKHFGFLIIPIVIFIILLERAQRRVFEKSSVKRLIAIFLISFSVFGVAWYVRNWIVVGNPVYPYLNQIFGGRDIDPWMMENSYSGHFSKIREICGLDFSFLNILLTIYTTFFRVSPYELLDLGPFIGSFFLVGLFFAVRERQKSDIILMAWALSYLFIWRFTVSTFLRYLVAAIPAFSILSGRALLKLYKSLSKMSGEIRVLSEKIPIRWILKTLLFILLLQGLLVPTLINASRGYKSTELSSPFISQEEFMSKRFLGLWDAIKYINEELPDNSVILTYDHSVAYYVEREFIFSDESRMKGIHIANRIEEVTAVLKENMVTHILISINPLVKKFFPLLSSSYLYSTLEENEMFKLVLDVYPAQIFTINYS